MSAPIRIVLVEDNPADVVLLREALRQQGVIFTIEHYSDGESAARAIAGMAERPDLILLDINVPRINGLELLPLVRGSEATAKTTTAMFTSSQAAADQREAERLGADGYIIKPPGYEEFMAQVGQAVQRLLKQDSGHAKRCRSAPNRKSFQRRAFMRTERWVRCPASRVPLANARGSEERA